MRRMLTNNAIAIPKLFHEEDISNDSSININLDPGFYLIELHQRSSSNIVLLKVGEEPSSISSCTLFNSGVVGTALGVYTYDTVGQILEIYDDTETNITITGHLDIYKF